MPAFFAIVSHEAANVSTLRTTGGKFSGVIAATGSAKIDTEGAFSCVVIRQESGTVMFVDWCDTITIEEAEPITVMFETEGRTEIKVESEGEVRMAAFEGHERPHQPQQAQQGQEAETEDDNNTPPSA